MKRDMKVAIASPGVGLVQRGFERFFLDIFGLMRDELDITMFKGGGPENDREKVLLFAHRNGLLVKALPVHRLFGRTRLHSECMTFALALLPHLRGGRYDVVHCIDPPLARVLYRLRAALGMRFRLLYTEGCAMPPGDYPPADHIQQVAKVTYDEAAAYGIPEEKMTLLPCGVDTARFETSRTKEELRREYGVDEGRFVILCVAALNRNHKRVDHLIDEACRMDGDFLVWLDGSLDHGDPGLADYARERLGDRVRVTHVASDKVGELYAMADVMVLPSLFESFGLAAVEGASTGLPVITHDAPHFRWLLPSPATHVDMASPGALAALLGPMMADTNSLDSLRRAEDVKARFDWACLKEGYAEMYRRVAEGG